MANEQRDTVRTAVEIEAAAAREAWKRACDRINAVLSSTETACCRNMLDLRADLVWLGADLEIVGSALFTGPAKP